MKEKEFKIVCEHYEAYEVTVLAADRAAALAKLQDTFPYTWGMMNGRKFLSRRTIIDGQWKDYKE